MAHYEIPSLNVGIGATASTSEVKKYLEDNPIKREAFIKDPIGELDKVVKEAAKPAYFSDKWIYRYVAISLGVAVLIAAAGAILLAWANKTVPDLLVAVASGAVGALAGLFAPTRG